MASNLQLGVALFVLMSWTEMATAADCSRAATSEGLVTLQDNQAACAPLQESENPDDLGRRYVRCVYGHLYVLPCPPGLRWDTSINSCNFPERATCGLPDTNVDGPPSQEETTIRTTEQSKRANRSLPGNKDGNSDGSDETIETTPPTRKTTETTGRTTRRERTIPPNTTTSSSSPTTTASTTTTETPSKASTLGSSGTTRNTTKTTSERRATARTIVTKTTEKIVDSTDCVAAGTSEGPRTLRHGQRACAPLRKDEDESDLGRRFVVCSARTVYTQECQFGLRFDTAIGLCNWPDVSTCQFEDGVTEDRSGPTQPPSKPPTSTGKPPSSSRTSGATQLTNKPPTSSRESTSSTRPPRPTRPGRCSATNCQLPACFCFASTPTAVATEDMPMFLMLTFDDAVTSTLYDSYFRALVVDNEYELFNPNGCRTKSTFYVSHVNTDYSLVKAIWQAGNEIGSHTIHHELPPGNKNSDYPEMVAEIQGLKDEMLKATGSQPLVDSVKGFRSPYLRVAGDVQFDVLRDNNFQYDTSFLNINNLQGNRPHWPYTLDYLVGECINPPCPTKAYPGLWEVPLNGWIGDDKQGCSMVDACVVGKSSWTATEEEWYQFYKRNFEKYFEPVKVPMPMFTHGFLFANYPNSYSAMARWFQDLLRSRQDVWLVTPAQVIDWMKTPLTNKEMIQQKWGC